jgi:hypothetical protein
LQILIEVRAKIVEDLDRTTGINDIMRGTSDARETMGAQRLKTNGAETRIQDERDEAARFCRDIICIMGEIVAEHYDAKTLIQVSGAMHDEGLDPPDLPMPAPMPGMMGHNGGPPMAPPIQPSQPGLPPQAAMPPQAAAPMPGAPPIAPAGPPQESPEQKQQRKDAMLAEAIVLLKNNKLRGFRIDIETDSTISGDAQEEKAARIEFIEGVTKFIETAAQVSAQLPAFAPLAGKMMQFAVRGFRVGRDLESAIEEFCDKAEQAAKDAQANPKPNPEEIKADSERYKADKEVERQRLENEGEAANSANDLRMKQIDLEMEKLKVRMAEIKLEEMTRKVNGSALEAGMSESDGSEAGSTKGFSIHPHLALDQIAKAASVFDLASKRNAAPRRVIRGPDGKASHIVTDFQEQG